MTEGARRSASAAHIHATSILEIDYSVPFETTKTNLLRSQSIIPPSARVWDLVWLWHRSTFAKMRKIPTKKPKLREFIHFSNWSRSKQLQSDVGLKTDINGTSNIHKKKLRLMRIHSKKERTVVYAFPMHVCARNNTQLRRTGHKSADEAFLGILLRNKRCIRPGTTLDWKGMCRTLKCNPVQNFLDFSQEMLDSLRSRADSTLNSFQKRQHLSWSYLCGNKMNRSEVNTARWPLRNSCA